MTARRGHPDRATGAQPTRRDFLRTTGLALGGSRLPAAGAGLALGGLAGCQPGQAPNDALPTLADLTPPSGPDDDSWAHVREHFILEPGIAYMNHASLGMPPRVVVDAVADGYRAISAEPLHGKHDLQDVIAQRVKPGLAAMFGADPGEMSLTRNATEALHLQTIGLNLEPGDEVLITTQEHPAGNKPWMYRAARHGIRVREVFIPSPLEETEATVARFAEAIGPRTKAMSFCHVTRGGHRYPVKELCALARERGLASLVDGAQAIGQFPIDLHDLGCDAFSASLHKWVLGPAGTGFLYIREGARDRFTSAFEPAPTREAPGYEPGGTADFPVRAALATAFDFVNALGIERIEARCRFLSDYLKSGLEELPGCTLLSGATPDRSAPGSTIFELEGLNALDAVPQLEQLAGTHIDEHQRDGHDAIRVSTHLYVTTAEIDRLLEGLVAARG
jgi:selenocysteine lyase/cysteine desulfurase